MKHFVFVSHYRQEFGPAEVSDLLSRIRARNERVGITGALLYDDGNIMQVIEGPDIEVDMLHRRLHSDPRLSDVIDLHTEHSEARLFPDWPMGCGPDAHHLSALWTPLQGHRDAEPSDVVIHLPSMVGGLLQTFDSRRHVNGLYRR